ncbi:MAG: CRISPR-associated endoribonuclease Cas6 [bacterium]
MIYSVVIHAFPTNDSTLPSHIGECAQSLFFEMIRHTDSRLARSVHGSQGVKPYTLSPLALGRRFLWREGRVGGGTPIWFRCTLLEDSLYRALMEYFVGESTPKSAISIGESEFAVTSITTNPSPEEEWAGFTSFEDLYNNAPARREIDMKFFTPTAFRRTTGEVRQNVPFPLPDLLFGSLLDRWNRFSHLKFDADSLKNAFSKNIAISQYHLKSQIVETRKAIRDIGFVGSCQYAILGEVDDNAVKRINALANFAFYSGAGIRVALGMGQVRRIDSK